MPGCVELRRLGIRCASSAAKEGLDHGRVVLDGGRITLVPWRPVIEQRLGQQLSAGVLGSSVSWQLGRQRGMSI
jgi:hypothetical protein